MFAEIISAEERLNALLPLRRLEQSPPDGLMIAARAWSQLVWQQALEMGAIPLTNGDISKGNNLARHPVFICGVHRSGTTLVRDLLDGHPELIVLPSEGTFYTNLESKINALPANERMTFLGTEWLRRLVNPINQPPYWLLGRSSDTGSHYVDFTRYLMTWWVTVDQEDKQWPHIAIILAYASCTGNMGAKFWVDKTPANERFLRRIWQEAPAARIIHVIRDPLATLASRKMMEPTITMREALLDLKISFRVAVEQSALNDKRFLLIRYEELCADSEDMVKSIASFLHIGATESLNQPTVASRPAQANSSFNKDAVPGKIIQASEHKQTTVLSSEEQELIAAYIGDLSGKLNYPLPQVGSFRKLYLKIKYRMI